MNRKEETVRLLHEVLMRRERGESVRGISRSLRRSRKKVRRLLAEAAAWRAAGETALEREAPPPPTTRSSKLDKYEEQIRAWLEQYPDLTAQRALEKLRENGYVGGYSIVRTYVKGLRPEPKEKHAFEVVETAPGKQGQFDWSPYELHDGTPVQAWHCILRWSRGRLMAAEDNSRQSTVLRSLIKSFEAFGGVPKQMVTDSMPGVVDRWECERPILNVHFVDFAAYYGFAADISPRRCPRYKAQVERGFWSAELSFLNGRTLHTIEQFREELARWLEHTVMQWKHPETKRPLADMMQEERTYLQPLPARPYDVRDVRFGMVDTQGYVMCKTNRYRVPDKAVGSRVYLVIDERTVEVFDWKLHLLAQHERLPDGLAGRVDLPGRKPRGRYDIDLLEERLGEWGQAAADFAAALRKEQHYPGVQLTRLLNLQLAWSADDVVKAMEHAMLYRALDAAAVERILRARFAPRTLGEQIAQRTKEHVRTIMQGNPVEQRPLSFYSALADGDGSPSASSAQPDTEDQDEQKED